MTDSLFESDEEEEFVGFDLATSYIIQDEESDISVSEISQSESEDERSSEDRGEDVEECFDLNTWSTDDFEVYVHEFDQPFGPTSALPDDATVLHLIH